MRDMKTDLRDFRKESMDDRKQRDRLLIGTLISALFAFGGALLTIFITLADHAQTLQNLSH